MKEPTRSDMTKRLVALFGVYLTFCVTLYAQSILPTATSLHDTTISVVSESINTEAIPNSTHPLYMSLRSNLLLDVAAIPDIGAEFYVGRNISVGGEWMYAWWSNDRRHRYWRIYGGNVYARYWLGNSSNTKPLTGHHTGIYFGAVTFDFELGGTAYMGGKPGKSLWDRAVIFTGIEYGYTLPISRRLNIDFSIGLGYAEGLIEKFHPEEGTYIWDSTIRKRWFGPTKAEVSLVWLIGRDNINRRREGKKP